MDGGACEMPSARVGAREDACRQPLLGVLLTAAGVTTPAATTAAAGARRSLQLQEQIRQLTEKKYELQQEEERSKQRPEEQREQLMAKIKRDNTEADQVGGRGVPPA